MPSGSARMRRTAVAAVLGVLVLLLSGCLKLDADLVVSPDDTVTGTYVVAYKKDPKVKQPGFTTARQILVTQGSADTRPFDDGQYLGTQYELRGVPFADLAAFTAVTVQGRQTGTVQLTREGDDVLVAGTFDFRETSATTRTAQQDADARRLFTVRIRLTFPGDVQSANGGIEGRVVSWDIPPFQRTVLQARAGAVPPPVPLGTGQAGRTGASRYALWVGIGLGGVAVALALVLLVRRLRRPRAEPEPTGPDASDFAWVLGERAGHPAPRSGADGPPGRDDRTDWGRPPPPRLPDQGPWDRAVAGRPHGAPARPGAGPARPGGGPGAPRPRPRPEPGEAVEDTRQWWGPVGDPPRPGTPPPGDGR